MNVEYKTIRPDCRTIIGAFVFMGVAAFATGSVTAQQEQPAESQDDQAVVADASTDDPIAEIAVKFQESLEGMDRVTEILRNLTADEVGREGIDSTVDKLLTVVDDMEGRLSQEGDLMNAITRTKNLFDSTKRQARNANLPEAEKELLIERADELIDGFKEVESKISIAKGQLGKMRSRFIHFEEHIRLAHRLRQGERALELSQALADDLAKTIDEFGSVINEISPQTNAGAQ